LIELTDVTNKKKTALTLDDLKPGDIFTPLEKSHYWNHEGFYIYGWKDDDGHNFSNLKGQSWQGIINDSLILSVIRYLPANEWQVREEE
jgi:hypothetical protein